MGGLTLTLVGLSLWLSARLTSPAEFAARLDRPGAAAPVTAMVELRALRRTVVLDGVVRSPAPVEVRTPQGIPDGQVVVTAPARKPGTRVTEGDRLVEVSGRPVFLLHGQTPMYRNLRLGTEGPDVVQLQLALARLGFRSWDRAGWFGPGTEASVRRFYRARGYRPSTERVRPVGTAGVAAGRLGGALPAPVERLVVPWWQLVFVRQAPTAVLAAPFAVGQRPDRPVLVLASGSPRVEVTLTDHQWALVRRGAQVRIEVGPGARRLDTTISAVQPVAAEALGRARQPAGAAGAAAGAGAAMLATRRALPDSDVGRPVRVTVEVERTPGSVLAVPVSAMWARADGSTHVMVVAPDGSREVPVEAGVSVDGMVEILAAGGAIVPGDLVVVEDQARG
jgi:peptidoglycan hydrolase-like protein with peptidoglycan-binding domain